MHSISDGLLMGLFILGFMVPWANEKGALVGGGFGMVIMSFWIGGIQWYKAHGRLKHHPLPTSVEGCPYPLNETISMTTTMSPTEVDPDDEPMIFFQISFLYFATIGALVVIVVGVIASYFFGMDLDSVNPDHITPFMRRYVRVRQESAVIRSGNHLNAKSIFIQSTEVQTGVDTMCHLFNALFYEKKDKREVTFNWRLISDIQPECNAQIYSRVESNNEVNAQVKGSCEVVNLNSK